MKKHFFKTFEQEFEAYRLLWYCPAGGSDFAEVATVTEKIKDGSYDSWFQEWRSFALKLERRADGFLNKDTKGNAYLRASRYYQAAEFFVDPNDDKKLKAYEKSVELFYKGLDLKGVQYELNDIDYGEGVLRSVYFPTIHEKSKGTVYLCGGFDALLEELYFTNGKYLLEVGYDVIFYEGPGQSHAIRYQGMTFEADWNKVVQVVKSFYMSNYKLAAYTVGIGVSLGGLLLSRAVSLDDTLFDKVVLYNYFPSMLDSIKITFPKFLHRYLYEAFPSYFEKIASFYISKMPFLNWQVEHAKWTFGANSLNQLLKVLASFDESIAYEKLHTDILILAAENDNYYDSTLADEFYEKIPSKNKKLIMFDKEQYSTDLHCENGSGYDANDAIIEWIEV